MSYQPPYTTTSDIIHLIAEISEHKNQLGLKDRKSFRERYLLPALAQELIEMTLPEKPNSPAQQYRLTEAGKLLTHKT